MPPNGTQKKKNAYPSVPFPMLRGEARNPSTGVKLCYELRGCEEREGGYSGACKHGMQHELQHLFFLISTGVTQFDKRRKTGYISPGKQTYIRDKEVLCNLA